MKNQTRLNLVLFFLISSWLRAAEVVPGTQPLEGTANLSTQMVAGIHRFLDRELEASVAQRAHFWRREFSSAEAYDKSVETNREHLRRWIGAVDPRTPAREFAWTGGTHTPVKVAETGRYTVHAVRWAVLPGVHGEGLLLLPKGKIAANLVALPDADQTPEQLCGLAEGIPAEKQFARRLAEQGCRVLVPVLLSRADTFSGDASRPLWTNLPHREWIWRMAWEVGRNPIGYEVQKILAAVDLFQTETSASQSSANGASEAVIQTGVIGYGEGGLLALYTAALDPRIKATVVSGYFDSRQRLSSEPASRMVWSLLKEFGDAELASLVVPRTLLVEFSEGPIVDGPPPAKNRANCAAPGRLVPCEFNSVDAEVERAKELSGQFGEAIQLIHGAEGMRVGFGSTSALVELLKALGIPGERLAPSANLPVDLRQNFDPAERQRRTIQELEDFTQGLVRNAERARATNFWKTVSATNASSWEAALPKFRRVFDEKVMGQWTNAFLPLRPRTRPALGLDGQGLVASNSPFAAFDVVLDVFPEVFAWGVLLLPKDLKPGERRPVVVCQHGLEGLPESCITEDTTARAFAYYKGFAAQLAKRGFVVFVPHNPYRGQDEFRALQRKSWLLGRHLFSTINAQHHRILDWLETQPFVDPRRIAFYGLSYGGKSAMRIPAVETRYCLSICSGDFNEWVRKNAATDYPSSYLYTGEYEIFEWDLGHTFNYAEMAALIAPRPFMVERGHDDGVGVDEWVDFEFAKVRRFYAKLGIADRTELEHFAGPHTINGVGTFAFLQRHLAWPR
jgi:dienelactone hydrolase